MKTLTIGFSRPKKWKPYAAAIMAIDKTDFDHCYMKFDSPSWRCSFIYQSSGSRTNFVGDKFFFKNNIAVREYRIDISDEFYATMGNLMVSREGLPYPIIPTIGKAFAVVWNKIFRKKISNPFKKYLSRPDCIQEASIILSAACKIEVPLDMTSITPLPFSKFVETIPGIRREI
jgi:hypothetical protein